jgi:ferrous iron transport protein B
MSCHTIAEDIVAGSRIALIGHPNVGKSVIFQRLTGKKVIISNYPGTTVDLMQGVALSRPEIALVDTPGVIALPSQSEDEQVTERVLLDDGLRAVLQVGDAKNLRRTLLLTVQLAEMGRPMVLVLNMMDEAEQRGVRINHLRLAEQLSLPVVPTTATRGAGVDQVLAAFDHAPMPALRLVYPDAVEAAAAAMAVQIGSAAGADLGREKLPVSARALALLWLSEDAVAASWLAERLAPSVLAEMEAQRAALQMSFFEPLPAVIQAARLSLVESLLAASLLQAGDHAPGFANRLSRLTTHPVWGFAILGVVLYSLYWFVGIFGAGTLVGLLEETLFAEIINPVVTGWVTNLAPFPLLADFLVGEYGLWTMGMTYAIALILPIVTTFFLAFGVLEDSGYLPRLAAFSNRLFQFLGLNGKAVLPMVLGLGCVTMATLTTRVLESKRERFLVTLLLALAVPCSAQLGVVMGMLAGISLGASLIWSGVILVVLLVVGWLAARLMPGERVGLLVELPPLRLPLLSNVLVKTLARLEWYIKEVVPLFLFGTALMFILDKTGVLASLVHLGRPLVTGWLGLPAEASSAFLMGFLRRDFGATGLFVMESQGLLNPMQVVVAMVTITLFIPCIASVMVIAKERSWKTAALMIVLVIPLAFVVGGLLFRALSAIGWGL